MLNYDDSVNVELNGVTVCGINYGCNKTIKLTFDGVEWFINSSFGLYPLWAVIIFIVGG